MVRMKGASKMKLKILIITAAVFGLFFLISNVNAGYLDTGWENITTYDGFERSGNTWWNTENEDQEVEPGAATGQIWDMEGFFFADGTESGVVMNSLAMVGGFDFAEGELWVDPGDIFIDTDMSNDYYEYVLDLNFDISNPGEDNEENNSTYTAYENTGGSITFNTTYDGPAGGTQGQAWTYAGGGTVVTGFDNIALNYLSNQSDSQMGGGLTGGSHNAAIVNLAFLGSNTNFNLWSSEECGNDVVTGGGNTSAAVPEPATLFLLGSGLLGFFGFRKKIRKSGN